MTNNTLKIQETFKIGEQVIVEWATLDSDKYDYESGVIVGLYINSSNNLRYMIRIGAKTRDLPHYQVLKK